LAAGFTVLSGRNGAGKSTVLDAIDFALTGTINKFNVKAAKGGGLDEHIWWVGTGKAESHAVSVGFVNEAQERFVVTRSRGAVVLHNHLRYSLVCVAHDLRTKLLLRQS
jgi:chromosome segregation protein